MIERMVMPGMGTSTVLLLFVGVVHGDSDASATPKLCRVSCISFEESVDSLCLFRDSRIDASVMDTLWLRGEAGDFMPSELRRAGPKGKIGGARRFAVLTTLDTLRIGGVRWGLVTEDLSCGFGSYAGPTTHVLNLSSGKGIKAARDQTGAEIILASTLKTVWTSTPDGFLMAACRPEFFTEYPDSIGFNISYVRYRWNKGRWVRKERRETGFNEFEDGVPDSGLFPR